MADLRTVLRPGSMSLVACLAAVILVLSPARAAPEASSPAGPAVPSASTTISLGAAMAQVPPEADSLAGSSSEAPGVAPARQRRRVSFTQHRLDRCASFMILEASGNRLTAVTVDKMDEFIVTNGFGLMKNIDQRWAVGGAVELYWARGAVIAAPALRCRRWFAREQSIEASLGYISNGASRSSAFYGGSAVSLVGPIVSARYSPIPGYFVQGGLCRYRVQEDEYDPLTQSFRFWSHDYSKGYGGIGLGGFGGAALWGVEALALGAVLVVAAGLSN